MTTSFQILSVPSLSNHGMTSGLLTARHNKPK